MPAPQRRVSDRDRQVRHARNRALLVIVIAAVAVGGWLFWSLRSTPPARDGAPNWSPDGRTIVFASEIGRQPSKIYVMDADDGGGRRALTRGDSIDASPAFSPDGQHIAFESNRDGNFEIYVMDRDGGNIRRLTNDPATDRSPAWSPDGSRIAFTSDRNQRASADVYTMDAATGGDVRRLTDDLANWAPQYSPDGQSLAVQVDQDIVIIDVASAAQRRLTAPPETGMNPTWSPDGSRIAFVTMRNRRAEIYSMRPDGSDQRVMVSMPGGAAIDPRWSPDGSRIAFVFLPETPRGTEPPADGESQAIYTLDVQSGTVKRLSP